MARRQRSDPQTTRRRLYPPGIGFHLIVAVAALFGWLALTGQGSGALALGVALAGGAVALVLLCWECYVLDAEGLTRVRLSGTTRWRWRELRGIAGTEVVREPEVDIKLGSGGLPVPAFRGRRTYMRRDVLYDDGSQALRLSPWSWRRDDLAKQIRLRVRAARSRGRED